jgi:flagellar motor switch protein FliG
MPSSTILLTDAGLRKAAILVASLDRAAADVVLGQLGPEPARRVRQAVVFLEEIPEAEREEVIVEFFRLSPERRITRFSSERPRGPSDGDSVALGETHEEPPKEPPFRRLREEESEKLARLLSNERPQTMALVLSHLPARQAGEVLVQLAPPLQAEVVRRLVNLEETDPGVLQEVEQALETRLSRQVLMQRRRVAGWEAVRGILETAEPDVSMRILENLAADDSHFADRLGSPAVEFEDLASLEDAILAEVFQRADPAWIMPALLGAAPEFVDRALQGLPWHQAAEIRQRLAQPGPIQLRDVETARRRLADAAGRILLVHHLGERGEEREER